MSRTATVQAQQRWEYMEITRKTEGYLINDMNEFGDLGWDVVSITFHKAAKSSLGESMVWTAFMKRPHVLQPHEAAATPDATPQAAPQAAAEPARDPNARQIEASDSEEEFTVSDAEYVTPEVDVAEPTE